MKRALKGGRVARLTPFASSEFRTLWLAVVVSQVGDWVHITALGWYVLELGGDAQGVTAVMAAGVLPQLLFTLAGGIAADRWPKRQVLRVIALAQLLASTGFALLVVNGTLGVPALGAVAFLLGCLAALWQPVYISFVPELVPADRLESAMGLSLSALYTARTVGPAVAGALIALVGTDATFFVNSLSFLAPVLALSMIKTRGGVPARRRSPLLTMRDSAAAVARDGVLLPLWLLTAGLSLLALPGLALIPVFVKDVFHAGAVTLGALTTAAGLGQLVGAVIVSVGALDSVRRGGLLQVGGYVLMGATLLAFALSPVLALALAAVFAFNLLHGLLSPRVNAIVQRRTDRGRGMAQSIFLLVFGFVPLGQLLLGWLAVRLGPVAATASFALAFTALAGCVLVVARTLRLYSRPETSAAAGVDLTAATEARHRLLPEPLRKSQ